MFSRQARRPSTRIGTHMPYAGRAERPVTGEVGRLFMSMGHCIITLPEDGRDRTERHVGGAFSLLDPLDIAITDRDDR
jgi:hypothetical protein